MTLIDQITLLEHSRDAKAMRLQALAAEPSPWVVEGIRHEDSLYASYRRGQLMDELLTGIDADNAQINRLVFTVAA